MITNLLRVLRHIALLRQLDRWQCNVSGCFPPPAHTAGRLRGASQALEVAYPALGRDVIRWLSLRHPSMFNRELGVAPYDCDHTRVLAS